MAVNTTRQSSLELLDFAVNQPIRASDYKKLIRQTNYLYARSGAIGGGITFDPAWTTTNTSYTQTNATSNGRDLDTWRPILMTPVRGASGGSEFGFIRVQFYTYRLDFRVTLYRADTGTQIDQTTNSGLNIRRWNFASLNPTWSACHIGGSTANELAPLALQVEFKLNTTFGGTGECHAISYSRTNLTSASIPDFE